MTHIHTYKSLCKTLNLLHMVVRFGCDVALVGYMSGTAQPLGCQQGVALMALSVCYINEFLALFKNLAGRLLCVCGILLITDITCPRESIN